MLLYVIIYYSTISVITNSSRIIIVYKILSTAKIMSAIASRRYPNTEFTRSQKLKAAVGLKSEGVDVVHQAQHDEQAQQGHDHQHHGDCDHCHKKCKHEKSEKCDPCDVLTPICVPSPHAVVYCGEDNVITKNDFKKDGVNGIIINKPGCYRLGGNIKFRPTARATTAITIAASGVIFDFGKYSIKQCNDMCDIYGIAITRCVSRVKITGEQGISKITNFTAAGVRVLGNTEHITIENIIVTQDEVVALRNADIPKSALEIIDTRVTYGLVIGEGDTGALVFKGTNQRNYVRDLTIKNIVAEKCVIGCQIVFTRVALLEDNLFTLNTYYGLLCGPFWFVPSLEDSTVQAFPVVENIIGRRLRGDRNNGPFEELSNPADTFSFDFLSGLAFYEAKDCYVEDCSASDNTSPTYLIAFDHDGSDGMVHVNHKTNGNVSTGSDAYGFHMSGSIPLSAGIPFGLYRPLQKNFNATIRGVVSCHNSSPTTSLGISFYYCDSISVEACTAQGQRSIGGKAHGFEVGGTIGITGGDSVTITFKDCVSQGNGDDKSLSSVGFRIRSADARVVIDNCIANGNNGGTKRAAGVFIDAPNGNLFKGTFGVDRVVVSNSVINANGTEEVDLSGGIVIYRNTEKDDLPISHILIDHNIISHNFGDGIRSDGDIYRLVIKKNEIINNSNYGVILLNEGPINTILLKNIAVTNEAGNYSGVAESAILFVVYPQLGGGECQGLRNWSVADQ